jgi:hypothetical protein
LRKGFYSLKASCETGIFLSSILPSGTLQDADDLSWVAVVVMVISIAYLNKQANNFSFMASKVRLVCIGPIDHLIFSIQVFGFRSF